MSASPTTADVRAAREHLAKMRELVPSVQVNATDECVWDVDRDGFAVCKTRKRLFDAVHDVTRTPSGPARTEAYQRATKAWNEHVCEPVPVVSRREPIPAGNGSPQPSRATGTPRMTDARIEQLAGRAHSAYHRAIRADEDPGDRLLQRSNDANQRLRDALLQRERETARHLGNCTRCGVRALYDVRAWPDMPLVTGECAGCGSTIAVMQDQPNTEG